jgi:UDP-GlcNAc:undecaprenyl-phosphate GlcNAc-1-phosphate transferase
MGTSQLLITMATSLIASGFLLPLAIKLGEKHGWVDFPGKHKRHNRPVPVLGGVVMFLAVWIALGVTILFNPEILSEVFESIFYIFLGALIILLVGLSDDLSPLPAWVKLLAEIAAGLTLYIGGIKVELVTTPFGSLAVGWLSPFISIAWVVILTNAINLIDGLDGLAGGVSLIGAAFMLTIGQLYQIGSSLLFLCAMIGFLIPFLYFNKYPAKIFLGDSGSLQIGFYFAVVSLVFPIKSFTFTALYVPVLALGVPVLETLSSIVRRVSSGKNVMKADRRHLFHYLALAGLTYRQVIIVFYSLAFAFGIFAIAMFIWDRKIVLAILVVFMVVIFALFLILMNKFPFRKVTR